MKKLILLLLLIPFISKAQTPVQVTQPYNFTKYALWKGDTLWNRQRVVDWVASHGGSGGVTPTDNILHWNTGSSYYTPFSAYTSNAFYWNGSVLDFGGQNNAKLLGSHDTTYWNLPLTRKIKASDTARWETPSHLRNYHLRDTGIVINIDNSTTGIPFEVKNDLDNGLFAIDYLGNAYHGSIGQTDSILATRGYVKNNSIRANATTTLTGNTAIIVPATEHPFYIMAASNTPAAGMETYVFTDSSFWSRIAGGKNKQSNSYNTIVADRTNIKLNSNGVNKATTVILDSIGLRYTKRNTESHHYISSPFGIPDKEYVDSLKNSIVTTDSTGILNNIYGKITPFATQHAGAFDNSVTDPVHTNRLNYDGKLYSLFRGTTTGGSDGRILEVVNTGTDVGISILNNSSGVGNQIINYADGSGIYINNQSSGNGLRILTYSSGNGVSLENSSMSETSCNMLSMSRTAIGTANHSGNFIYINDNPTTSGTKSGSILKATIGSTERLRLDPRVKGNADSTAYVFDTDRQLLATDTLFNIKNHGSGKFKVLYNGDLILSGNIKNPQYTGSLTDVTPTSSEITSIVGSASTKGAGFKAVIKDSNGTGLLYIVESDGTYWYYTVMTKAL